MAVKTVPLPPPRMYSATTTSFWPRLTFTQGVLLGQLSMVILAVLFLRYVVFEDPGAAKRERELAQLNEDGSSNGNERRKSGAGAVMGTGEKDPRKKRRRTRTTTDSKISGSGTAATVLPETASSILGSIGYDLSSHSPESLDWLNVLIAQLLSSYRLLASNHLAGGARGLIEDALNRKVRPNGDEVDDGSSSAGLIGLDEIQVDEVELGEGYPELSNARVRPSGNTGEGLRVELDLDYTDKVSLAVSTRVVMNFPRPRFAVLPVSLALTLQRFSGTVTIELPTPTVASPTSNPSRDSASNSSNSPHQHPSIYLSLHPDFTLDLATSSLLGSRAKLEDVPKVEQLLNARIRSIIQDRVVWPGRVEISLPGIQPHHHHHHHHHKKSLSKDEESMLTGEPVGGMVDDWTMIDRPHPLACENENLPPSFSVSDFKHRNADSDTEEDDNDDVERHDESFDSTRRRRRRRSSKLNQFSTSTPPLPPPPGESNLGGRAGFAKPRANQDDVFNGARNQNQQDDSDRKTGRTLRDRRNSSTSTSTSRTPSVDLEDPSGPTISLHPRIRKRSNSTAANNNNTTTSSSSPATRSKSKPSEPAMIRGQLNVENLRSLERGLAPAQAHSRPPVTGVGRGGTSPSEKSFPGYFPASAFNPPGRGHRTTGSITGGIGTGTSTSTTAARFRGIGGVGAVGLSTR
ncbi:ERMES complex subunit MMM1 [Sporobolomyces koalae]|uniref:ERMES complex subunit MMM1 n=1 Tax=Sporobolomyces koalae TaxID=500713 RepID=UPI0031801A7A